MFNALPSLILEKILEFTIMFQFFFFNILNIALRKDSINIKCVDFLHFITDYSLIFYANESVIY